MPRSIASLALPSLHRKLLNDAYASKSAPSTEKWSLDKRRFTFG
jgi:hypothetical protein